MQYTGRSFAEMIGEHLLPRFLRPRTTRRAPRRGVPVRERVRVPLPRPGQRAGVRAVLPKLGRAILPASNPPAGKGARLPGLHGAHGRPGPGLGVRPQVMEDGRERNPRAPRDRRRRVERPARPLRAARVGRRTAGDHAACRARGRARPGGRRPVLGDRRQSTGRVAVVAPRCRVPRGRRRPVGHLPGADLPDLAPGGRLRAWATGARPSIRRTAGSCGSSTAC